MNQVILLDFFLTGSSARKLKRGSSNLLPGRIFPYRLSGFCAKEMNYTLDTEKVLRFVPLQKCT